MERKEEKSWHYKLVKKVGSVLYLHAYVSHELDSLVFLSKVCKKNIPLKAKET